MKKIFVVLTVLFAFTTTIFAQDLTIGDCESIEMECIGSSLWCDSGEVIGD